MTSVGVDTGVRRRWSSGLTLLAFLGLQGACSGPDENGISPSDQGYHEVQVSGDNIGINLSGNAIFGVQPNSEEWVVFMWRGDIYGLSFNVTTVFRENSARPEPGTYTIYDTEDGTPTANDFLAAYVFAQTASIGAFNSVSGTLTITASSDAEVTGTFQFDAVLDPSSVNVTAPTAAVSGSFRAVPGEIPY